MGLDPQRGPHHVGAELQRHDVDEQLAARANDLFDVRRPVQFSADGGALGSAAAYHYLFHLLKFLHKLMF